MYGYFKTEHNIKTMNSKHKQRYCLTGEYADILFSDYEKEN
jgi:hypothetical protein